MDEELFGTLKLYIYIIKHSGVLARTNYIYI